MSRPHKQRWRCTGFTLTEAVVAMVVLLLLIAITIPGLRGLLLTQGIRNASTDLYSTLTRARSEAIMRNTPVSVAPVNGDWTQGWLVHEADGSVIQREAAPKSIEVTGPPAVTFSSEGRPDATRPPFQIAAESVAADKARCVKLNLGGRPAVHKGPC